jgi:hypothetical protein
MKYLFLLACCLPIFSFAQTYALLDRQMMQPVEVTDTLESGKIAWLYFPVNTTDLDLMIKTLDQFIEILDRSANSLLETEIQLGSSRMLIHKGNKHDMRLSILLFTRAKDHGFTMQLVQETDSKRRALQKMKTFLYYLRNNRFLVREKAV